MDKNAQGIQNGHGDEDTACADYISALLQEPNPDPGPFLSRVRASPSGRALAASTLPDFPAKDLEYCLAVDRFDFAMPVLRRGDLLLMHPAY